MRQSAAKVLARTICELFPTAQLVEAREHEWGFYCDFLPPQAIDANFLIPLEETMRGALKKSLPIDLLDMMRENAVQFFAHRQQPLIAEQIAQAPDNIVQLCRIGEFYDYHANDLVASTDEIGAVKLCTLVPIKLFLPEIGEFEALRIEGTAFPDPQKLKRFLKQREKALRVDHFLLGQESGLFALSDNTLSFWKWLPKGHFVQQRLIEFWCQAHINQNFQLLTTPLTWKLEFAATDDSIQIATPKLRSHYHAWCFQQLQPLECQLPMRFAECGEWILDCPLSQCVGLLRTPYATSDTATIFCTREQLESELISSLQFIYKIITMVAFEWRCYCISVPNKQKSSWKESALKSALTVLEIPFETEEGSSEPDALGYTDTRIEFVLYDAMGRAWRGPRLQIDEQLPRQLSLRYREPQGGKIPAVMLTRTLFGTLEAFIALLIERYEGFLPLWLAPEQVRVIATSAAQQPYAEKIYHELRNQGVRAGICANEASLGSEVHRAEREKLPYLLIVGAKEEGKEMVTIRRCGGKGDSTSMKLAAFLQQLQNEVVAWKI